MAEKLFIGVGSKVYTSDAEPNGATENDFALKVRTRAIAPAGLYGEVVFRRASLTVTHTGGFSLRITPILDGKVIDNCVSVFSSSKSPSGRGETVVLDIPLGIREKSGNATGARGSVLQLEIESLPLGSEALAGTLSFDNVQVLHSGGHAGGIRGGEGGRSTGNA